MSTLVFRFVKSTGAFALVFGAMLIAMPECAKAEHGHGNRSGHHRHGHHAGHYTARPQFRLEYNRGYSPSRGGYSSYHQRSHTYPRWHDTSHYDWHDTSHYDWHGDHYDFHPSGHYDFHRQGHWDD